MTGRCADISEAAGEGIAATATNAENWLLLEVRGTWPRDVSDDGCLDDASAAAARAWLERTPSSRLLFVRRPGRTARTRLAFVVRAAESETAVRRIELGDGGLAGVDLAVDGADGDTSLVLVCGHGTRDACCALRGSAVFGVLRNGVAEESLWLSSHQGGHRFAANVLVLPVGIQLGRIATDDAAAAVTDALAGRIRLDRYRGRTAYTPREQAAEQVVRESSGLLGVADVRLAGDDGTTVRFVDSRGHEHGAVVRELAGPDVPASCGASPEPQKHVVARLAPV